MTAGRPGKMAFCCFPSKGRGGESPETLKAVRSQNFQGDETEARALWRAGQKVKVALVGLDDAGKTSLVHSLQ